MVEQHLDKPSYPIGSVDSALRLLLLIGERKQLRIAEASRELGFARSTAHRLLQMLQYYGFVSQDPDSKAYVPGPALTHLGLQVVRGLDIRTVARPHLQQLVDETGETAHLLEFETGGKLLCLDSVETPRALRIGGRVGMSLPAFASAAGRAMLALMPLSEVQALYPAQRLPKLHPATITRRSELMRELELTRERGYAVQSGETEPGVSGVAAAVVDSRSRSVFAVTVAIPSTRLTEDGVPGVAAAAQKCAAEIGALLPW